MPTMQRNPSYLTLNRHRTFYFRIVIPQHLRFLLSERREIRRTLKTDSLTLARRRARQYAARYQAAFDRVTNVIERDELGLSEDDYTELLDQMPDFSSPTIADKAPEPILSNDEIEARQRRREVERLLTGVYGRPIPSEQESLAQHLLELSLPYMPTELGAVLPKLRDEVILSKLKTSKSTERAIEMRLPAPRTGKRADRIDEADSELREGHRSDIDSGR